MLGASSTSQYKAAKNLRVKKSVFRLGNIDDVYPVTYQCFLKKHMLTDPIGFLKNHLLELELEW